MSQPEKLSLAQVWHLALFGDVELRGREVWANQAPGPHEMKLEGVLADDATVEEAEAEIAEAYGK